MTIIGNFERFQYFNFEADFVKTKIFFKKLESSFLVESTSFRLKTRHSHNKTAISKANVQTNRMVSTKWTYRKELCFASNYLIFWKFCFSLNSNSHLPKKLFFICFNDGPSKVIKNAFYFILKSLFLLKIFKFLSWLFGHVG